MHAGLGHLLLASETHAGSGVGGCAFPLCPRIWEGQQSGSRFCRGLSSVLLGWVPCKCLFFGFVLNYIHVCVSDLFWFGLDFFFFLEGEVSGHQVSFEM